MPDCTISCCCVLKISAWSYLNHNIFRESGVSFIRPLDDHEIASTTWSIRQDTAERQAERQETHSKTGCFKRGKSRKMSPTLSPEWVIQLASHLPSIFVMRFLSYNKSPASWTILSEVSIIKWRITSPSFTSSWSAKIPFWSLESRPNAYKSVNRVEGSILLPRGGLGGDSDMLCCTWWRMSELFVKGERETNVHRIILMNRTDR